MRPREMPWAPEAEISVLGGMLMDMDATARMAEAVDESMFHDPRNRRVFAAMLRIYRTGSAVDPVTVSEDMKRAGTLDEAGGLPYLAELLDAVPTAANIEYHANIVRDRALRRRLWDAGRLIAEAALATEDRTPDELVDYAEHALSEAGAYGPASGPRAASEVLWSALGLVEHGGAPGLPTGLLDLDALLAGGFKPGTLNVIAGATSMGKSALALQAVAHAAVELRVPTLLCSVEMTNDENMLRLLAMEGNLNLAEMVAHGPSEAEFSQLNTAAARVKPAPLWLEDDCTRVLEVRSRARRAKVEHGIGLLVVDHIHDMSEAGETRREQLGSICRGLKHLAKELAIPVIAVAQLNREPAKRTGNRPQLSDLHESGDIEQVANTVTLLYRPGYYDQAQPKWQAEAIVAKHRNGPTGSADLYFRETCVRFENADKGHTASEPQRRARPDASRSWYDRESEVA